MSSKYFRDSELACKCGCGMLPKPELVALADRVREEWGRPLLCLSAARCPTHNQAVHGAPHSHHMEGLAVDLAPAALSDIKAFQAFCRIHRALWNGGKVGMEDPRIATTWVHLQLRPPYEVFLP